ncbi:MAG: hypothetical protein ACTMIR_04420 [Cellulomonadaceae bacterium]
MLAVAAACSGTPDDSPTATPTSTSPTSSQTATPTSDTETAAANAEALVREYYRVIDELGADPSKPLAELDAVASGDEVEIWRDEFERERHDGWRQVGATRIAKLTVQSVNLDNSASRVPTVQVDVCFDVSDVDVVDGSGTSVITAERPDTGWVRHTVSNSSWDTDPESGWRVSTSVDLEQPSCQTAD